MMETLFLDIPYSEALDKVKQKIKEALLNAYEKEKENYIDLQAAGRVMEWYGTLEDAGILAGYSIKEIKSWGDSRLGIDVKEFRRIFRKERRFIYLEALAVAAGANYVLNFLMFRELGLLIFIAIAAGIWFCIIWRKYALRVCGGSLLCE